MSTTYVSTQDRVAPQNRMGIAMDEGTTLNDALLEARLLGWNTRLSPLLTLVGNGDEDLAMQEVPNKYAVIGNDVRNKGNFRVLGSDVSQDFTCVDAEPIGEFVTDLLDVSKEDLYVQAAGDYKGGSQCFINLRRPEGVLIGGSDLIQTDLFVHWGHDGKTAITIKALSMRMFCTNQIGGMLGKETAPTFKVRHVGKAQEGRVAEARAALNIMAEGRSAFEVAAEEWASKSVTNRTFDQIVEGLLPELSPVDVHPAQVTRRNTDRDTLHEIYDADPMKGNAWGALNSWTEMGDWYGNHADDLSRAIAQVGSADLEHRRVHGARTIAGLLNLQHVA